MNINVDFTEEEVISFLRDKSEISEDILSKFKEEKIDGEALILLRKNDFKRLGIEMKDKYKILDIINKDITKKKTNINNDDLYLKVTNQSSSKPWDYLENNSSKLKLGGKLKYIKYFFIKNKPPGIEKVDELFNYIKKYIKIEDNLIKKFIDNLKDILNFTEQLIEEQFQEWKIAEEDEQFKLRLIIEFLKSKDNNLTYLEKNDVNPLETISLAGDYNLYSMVELYNYETSQEDITSGLINPIMEYKKLCQDFNINFKDDGTYLNYKQALKIKITTSMIWGTKESLKEFFQEKGINNAISYFEQKEKDNKAGIYLCINKETLYAFLIVWPGELDYKYSKIDEPKDNILLTLIRYGFSITSNSLLCFTNKEIKDFNFEGFEIFRDIDSTEFEAERGKIIINVNNEKNFDIGEQKSIKLGNLKFKNKITDKKINQNSLLIYEEKENTSTQETYINDIEEFLRLNSESDIYFSENFQEINPSIFYFLIRKNHVYLKDIDKETNYFSNQSLKDAFKRELNKSIDNLLKPLFNALLDIKSSLNKYLMCEECKQIKDNEIQDINYIIEKNKTIYFHQNCYKKYLSKINSVDNIEISSLKNVKDNEGKIVLYEMHKKFYENIKELMIEAKNNYKYDILSKYCQNCEESFKNHSVIFSEKIISDEKENIKEYFTTELYNNLKKELIPKEIKNYEDLKSNKQNYKKIFIEWETKWKKKINDNIKDNNIGKYILLKSCEKINKGESKMENQISDWKIHFEYKESIQNKIYISLYQIKPIQNTSDLTLVFNRELGDDNTVENYFPSFNKGLIIKKSKDKLRIKFKDKNIEEYQGLYDYDKISDTLILYREEGEDKKLGIYFNIGVSQTISCNEFVSEKSIINKIMLVPCYPAYEKQSFLLFIDNEIHMIQINNKNEFPKIICLDKEFKYNKFSDLQFIIHIDFILILLFNKEEKKWEGKVYSLCLEDDSLFDFIKEIEINEANDNAKFSFAEIKENKYLFSVNIIENMPLINYWEINSKLSGITTDYQERNKKKQEKRIISQGNCVINYFYHCFEKYPLLGALPYKFQKYDKKTLKFSFYLKDDIYDKKASLEKYLDMLKIFCENKKKTTFHDINFSICSNFSKFFLKKNSSIGLLIINLLEVTPIQIAKIMENEFKIMSNGEKIEKKIYKESKDLLEKNKEAKIEIQNYSEIINFCMKDTIFNYFEIPVVVICCFGTQSIGKSTFLNELTGSTFDVSGRRCTEGIWMSIKLYLHNLQKKEKATCKNICSNCNKNKCEQLIHEEVKYCLCNEYSCDKECFFDDKNLIKNFISCFKKCCLKKGHEIDIKCSFENCGCKCICECICSKNKIPHKHICNECSKKKNNFCECDCNCKHFCGVPIILHNFICVCLDFEGLGTFERTQEQDIQMALVGSAIGNSIIFRTGNTFDKFTENTLEKLALGSNKLKDIKIEQFFGGSLFFSPRDVNSTDREKLKGEFNKKIENSVKKWNYSLINSNENKNKSKINKNTIFGIFEDNVFAPTPNYPDYNFYKTLRENLTKEIIENTLKYKRNPKYRTGKEFYSNLKLFLSAVYMNEYNFLTNFGEKKIRRYIYENIDKAYGIGGITKLENLPLLENNNFKYYIKNDKLQELEVDFLYNKKFKNSKSLLIENINSSLNIQGNYINEKYGIKISVNKSDYNYTISLENFKDFGLILLLFKEIKDLNYDNLCSNLFEIWDSLCKTIGLKENAIIEHFSLFIQSIITRRKKNVQKWLEEITKSHENLKDLRNQYSIIDNIWILCRQKCKYCYYNCFLLQGHKDEHRCPYDHKCKEKCNLCEKSECSETNCKHNCEQKAGHHEEHKCNHLHQCKENCIFKNNSKDCQGRCILNIGHEKNHTCGLSNHHCNENCELYTKANNCKGKCSLLYPHEGKKHDCGEEHFCMMSCYLKDKAKGCKIICSLKYGHEGNHFCSEKHICIENCNLMGKAKNCLEKCILPYPHDGKIHDCGNEHYCINECSLINKTSGCNKICNLIYGHEGNHNCGEKHFCISDCSLLNLSEGCGKKCALEYPHEGKEHLCSREHFCKKNCKFDGISKACSKKCVLKYKHSGDCICSFKKEQHICNKKCYNCQKDCILISGHEFNCICGLCKCPENCKYKDCSRGCNIKCYFNAGHIDKDHICNSRHFCKEECLLKNNSKNCEGYCSFEYVDSQMHSYHICNIPMEKHGCKGICSNFNNSRNCKKICCREVNHSGDHQCEININLHLCKHKCEFFGISLNCKEICNLPFNHEGNHICQIEANNHLCNKKCSLFNSSREGCNQNCSLKPGHTEQCLCENTKEKHICNKICNLYYKSKGCKNLCSLITGHAGEHLCQVSKEEHICKGICSLKGKTRGKCYETCCLPYGHKGLCFCKKNLEHLCDKECSLINKSKNCKKVCNKRYGHSDEHLCDEIYKHICNKYCYYFGKCKGNCDQFCKKEYGHTDKCDCKISSHNSHLCFNFCFYYGNSRGCNKECAKKFEHEGSCECNVKPQYHFCKIKCELCESECGHVYNHENSQSKMRCCKCKDQICALTGNNHHICGGKHNCMKKCQAEGWCEIKSYVQFEEKVYKSKNGEPIYYKVKKSQEIIKKYCRMKIKENETSHNSYHFCEVKVHKCGYQCPQCEYYCTEDVGHKGLHNCYHGNIKNSYISVSDKGLIAKVKKYNKVYNLQIGEKAIMFFCDEYCKEQGQGHIHQFISNNNCIKNDENVRLIDPSKHIYECKCSYYWNNILKFRVNFTTEEQNKFSLCNWHCKYSSHQIPEYCQLPLWHKNADVIPLGVYGKWIFEGHIFKCSHSIAHYTIFLIDQSQSMKSETICPTNNKIKGKFNNMLGASIQAIDSFCKLRIVKSIKDKCSLIGFNTSAKVILKDINIANNEGIINSCISKLKPSGGTKFLKAFKECYYILQAINRTEFIPIIILLSDGLDNEYDKTKPFIEKVRKSFFYI